jgi:iron(III) transport system substrate-binding protein
MIMVRFAIFLVAGVLAIATAAVAAQTDWKKDWEETLAAAKKEGRLVLYGSADYEQLFGEFQKKYPEIKVTGVFGRGADVAKRILAERRAEKFLADVYVNGQGTGYNVLYKSKTVDPLAPMLMLPEVTDTSKWWQRKHHYADPENRYLIMFNGAARVVVGYNTKLVNPSQMRSYWDMLEPRWRGKIVALDPSSGGAGDALRFFYYHGSLGREYIRCVLVDSDPTISADTRQMGDWLAAGRFAFSIFSPISRMDLDKMQTQGLPVDWFDPDHLKEGAYIAAGSGGAALMNRAPNPNAAKLALNWLLSREGQIAYQRIFTLGDEGPDSLRIDIPKDKIPRGNRRPEGDESKYPVVDRAEWMDMSSIRAFTKEVLEQRKR